jgi:hypothetical protein
VTLPFPRTPKKRPQAPEVLPTSGRSPKTTLSKILLLLQPHSTDD